MERMHIGSLFDGSSSTGVAALNTNRRFIGIELDTTYCGMAKQRIQDADISKEEL